jgi:lauroyl/myristoyl acyltransferase
VVHKAGSSIHNSSTDIIKSFWHFSELNTELHVKIIKHFLKTKKQKRKAILVTGHEGP